MSAHAYFFGEFSYNAHPLAPLGTSVEMHVVPEIRETFATHSASGFYIGTSLEHYRCHKVWLNDTRAERVLRRHCVFQTQVSHNANQY